MVEATPISGPAFIGNTQRASLAIELSSTLTIAHRLSTIINSDKILVLAEGTLIERGSHHELLKKNGRYAEMWHHQRKLEKARIFLEEKNESESI